MSGTEPEEKKNDGFAAITQTVKTLTESTNSRFGLDKSSSNGIKLSYALAVDFELMLEAHWEVVTGFILKEITLVMVGQAGSFAKPSLGVSLTATGTIGELDFTVQAELPNLQEDEPVMITFTLSLRSSVSPDAILNDLGKIIGDAPKASTLIDPSLQGYLKSPIFEAALSITFIKPPGEGFSFVSLLFEFGGQIDYKPSFGSSEHAPKITIKNGKLLFALTKEPVPDSKLEVIAQLEGRILVGETPFDTCVSFSYVNKIFGFTISIQTGSSSLYQMVTADEFANSLALTPGTGHEDFSIMKLAAPPEGFGLDSLRGDLTLPTLGLSLFVGFEDMKLDRLLFQLRAREAANFHAGFLGDCAVRNLMLVIDLAPGQDASYYRLYGTLVLADWSFAVEFEFLQDKEKDLLRLRADLENQVGPPCSLADVATIDIFNPDTPDVIPTDLVSYANENPVKANPDIDLGLADYEAPISMSFELTCSRVKAAVESPKDPGGSEVAKVEPPKDFGIDAVRFSAGFGASWKIIPGHVTFVDLGIAFNVSNPTTDKRLIDAGLLYGRWELEQYTLWTYVYGRQTNTEDEFWVGLNLKSSSGKKDGSFASILADPKFVKGLKIPSIGQEKGVAVTSPDKQQLKKGLVLDGSLKVQFLKDKNLEDKTKPATFAMKTIKAQLTLEADFQIFDTTALVGAAVYLHIDDPLLEARRIHCEIMGSLSVNNIYVLIAASINVVGTPQEPPKRPELQVIEKDMQKAVPKEAQVQKLEYSETPDELVFMAYIGTEKKLKVGDTLASLVSPQSEAAVTTKAQEEVPAEYPAKAGDFLKSLEFKLELRVGKHRDTETRVMKSLTISATAVGTWDIIKETLTLKDAALNLIVTNPRDTTKRGTKFILRGTLNIFKTDASITTAIVYDKKILYLGIVVTINLSKLVGGFTDLPGLIKEHDKTPEVQVVASVVATVQEKSFKSYIIRVQSLSDIPLLSSLKLTSCALLLEKTATSTNRLLQLSGSLLFGNDDDKKRMKATTTVSITGSEITVIFRLERYSPGVILNAVLADDAPDAGDRPMIPKATGFADWNSENAEIKSKTPVSASLLVREHDGGGRRVEKVTLSMSNSTIWSIIDDWLSIGGLTLSVVYEVPSKKLALELEGRLFFKRSDDGKVPKQATEDLSVYKDSYPLKLRVQKDAGLAFDLTLETEDGDRCTFSKFVYFITGGFLDVSPDLGIPIFVKISGRIIWSQQKFSLAGYMLHDNEAWEFNKLFGKIAKMKKPRLELDVTGGEKSDVLQAWVKGTAELFSFIDVEIAFKLPKGPLLVAGLDVQKIVDIIKKLWNLLKDLKNIMSRIKDVASAIGSFIASVVVSGVGLVGVAAFFIGGIVGGVLGGAAWALFKSTILKTLLDIIGPRHRRDIEEGLEEGYTEVEGEGSTVKIPQLRPTTPEDLLHYVREAILPEPTVKDDTRIIYVYGTGSCSGLAGEEVELFVVPLEGAGVQPTKYQITVSLAEVEIGSKSGYAGSPVRFVYKRPTDPLKEYNVHVNMVATNNNESHTASRRISLKTMPDAKTCISTEKSKLEITGAVSAGLPYTASLILCDEFSNISDGYFDHFDPRPRNDVRITSTSTESKIPQLSARRDGYLVNFPPLTQGAHSYTILIDGEMAGHIHIQAVPVLDLQATIASGRGLCSGIVGENVEFTIKPRDMERKPFKQARVTANIILNNEKVNLDLFEDTTSNLFQGSYSRPSHFGQYSLEITINESILDNAPISLYAHEDKPASRKRLRPEISKTALNIHSHRREGIKRELEIRLIDPDGRRWRQSGEVFTGATIVCQKDGRLHKPDPDIKLEDLGDGRAVYQVEIEEDAEYEFKFKTGDGDSPEFPYTFPESSDAVEILYAYGDGLQTGHEGSLAYIELAGYKDMDNETTLHSSQVKATIHNGSYPFENIEYKIQKRRISYRRPMCPPGEATRGRDYFIRVFHGSVEAYGSPFCVRSAPFIGDVAWALCRSHVRKHDTPSGPALTNELVIVDNYGGRKMTTSSLRLTHEPNGATNWTAAVVPPFQDKDQPTITSTPHRSYLLNHRYKDSDKVSSVMIDGQAVRVESIRHLRFSLALTIADFSTVNESAVLCEFALRNIEGATGAVTRDSFRAVLFSLSPSAIHYATLVTELVNPSESKENIIRFRNSPNSKFERKPNVSYMVRMEYQNLPIGGPNSHAGEQLLEPHKTDSVGQVVSEPPAYWKDLRTWTEKESQSLVAHNSRVSVLSRGNTTKAAFWMTPTGSIIQSTPRQSEDSRWRLSTVTSVPNAAADGLSLTTFSRGPDHLEVAWISPDGAINGASWHPGEKQWKPHPKPIAPTGSASTEAGGRIVGRARSPSVMHLWWIRPEESIETAQWSEDSQDWMTSKVTEDGEVDIESELTSVCLNPDSTDIWWLSPTRRVMGARCVWQSPARTDHATPERTIYTVSELAALPRSGMSSCVRTALVDGKYVQRLHVWWVSSKQAVMVSSFRPEDSIPWTTKKISEDSQVKARGGLIGLALGARRLGVWWVGDEWELRAAVLTDAEEEEESRPTTVDEEKEDGKWKNYRQLPEKSCGGAPRALNAIVDSSSGRVNIWYADWKKGQKSSCRMLAWEPSA